MSEVDDHRRSNSWFRNSKTQRPDRAQPRDRSFSGLRHDNGNYSRDSRLSSRNDYPRANDRNFQQTLQSRRFSQDDSQIYSATNIWNEQVSNEKKLLLPLSLLGSSTRIKQVETPMASVLRTREVNRIEGMFNSICTRLAVKQPKQVFTRWLVDQDHQGEDPLIPESPFFAQLEEEMTKDGCSADKLREIIEVVTRECRTSLDYMRAKRGATGTGSVTICDDRNGGKILELEGQRLSINGSHYKKLFALHRRWNVEGSDFLSALFCLVNRYTILNDIGFQAALHEEVFDSLFADFGVTMECFASPLNCRFGLFCSAFADTDEPFGSMGSFFSLMPETGSFEVNPPFTVPIMLQAARHIENLLVDSQDRQPLSFIVVVPCWTDAGFWQEMRASRFLRRLMIVRREDHGYVVGNQHNAPKRHLPATFHTGVFFLQNRPGMEKWGPTEEYVAKLREAFTKSCPSLTQAEKQRQGKIAREKKVRDAKNGWAAAGVTDNSLDEFVSPDVHRLPQSVAVSTGLEVLLSHRHEC